MTEQTPAIDYTDKDFRALRRALHDFAAYRLPEWTDRSAGDLGSLFLDMFAYTGDVVLYHLDRVASELYLDTAVERRSVMNLLRLIGYELTPPASASAEVTLVFTRPADGSPTVTTIPRGLAIETKPAPGAGEAVPFVFLGPDRTIDLAGDAVRDLGDDRLAHGPIPVLQGRLRDFTVLGGSRGEPGLRLALPEAPVQLDTVTVQVRQGGVWTEWQRRSSLFVDVDDGGDLSVATARSEGYMLEVDENGDTWVVFGDGEFHRRPPVGQSNIRAAYVVGGGLVGNVGPGTITEIVDKGAVPHLDAATNEARAVGGADAEPIEHAATYGPLSFRSRDRAVTLRDHVTLARGIGGVAKVRAETVSWNRVDLFVAPAGPEWSPLTEDLRGRIVDYLDDRRMIGTSVRVRDAEPVAVDISTQVLAEPHHDADAVRALAEAAVRGLVAYDAVDFGLPLYLSKVYEAVEAIDGVRAATVTRFVRHAEARATPVARGWPGFGLEPTARRLGLPGGELEKIVRRAVLSDIPPDGRVEIGPHELAVPGTIEVTLGAG